MALHATGERTLEKYKIFPYIAWGLVFGFSFFVYTLVTDLQETANSLRESTIRLEHTVLSDKINAKEKDTAAEQ